MVHPRRGPPEAPRGQGPPGGGIRYIKL